MKKYSLGNVGVTVYDNGKFDIDNGKTTNKTTGEDRPNFEVNVDGNSLMLLDDKGFSLADCIQEGNKLTLRYESKAENLEVTAELENISGAIIQTNTIKNTGNESIKLTRFSSAFVENIAHSDDGVWYDKDIVIHICHSKWQCEGQWRAYTPSELGLCPATMHSWERESYRISSLGSWCTGNFYPLVIIENKTDNNAFFMETEGSHSWQIKLTVFGGYVSPSLAVEATSCDEGLGGWYYDLKPGESYRAERAFYGTVCGGFEEAVKTVNEFKRADSTVKPFIPLVFNDYMDCIWGSQKPEYIIPLIDKAAEAGCEYFCIDGGWQWNKNGWGKGDWIPRTEYFSEVTFKDLADRMKEKGLIPGVWFEFDACSETAELFRNDKDAVIRRYDRAVGGGEMHFYNFKNKNVRNYLTEKVREFYDMGYRFIKNDYNQSTGIGCTNTYDGDSPAEGLIENTNAFYDFIDSLYEKFPGLVIENCGSGALRCDNKTLRRFTLQSTSDQELYINNPSILMGSESVMPPEKAGIWAYPYPTVLGEYDGFVPSEEYIKERADGKETAFNMVTAMMGVMYLSGRIDLCDEKNFELIKQGVEIYKDIREYIPKSRPIYPTGMHSINQKEIASMGLLSEERLMIAVWNTDDKECEVSIDLSGYIPKDYAVNRVYSHKETEFSLENGSLKIMLEGKSAVWFEIL